MNKGNWWVKVRSVCQGERLLSRKQAEYKAVAVTDFEERLFLCDIRLRHERDIGSDEPLVALLFVHCEKVPCHMAGWWNAKLQTTYKCRRRWTHEAVIKFVNEIEVITRNDIHGMCPKQSTSQAYMYAWHVSLDQPRQFQLLPSLRVYAGEGYNILEYRLCNTTLSRGASLYARSRPTSVQPNDGIKHVANRHERNIIRFKDARELLWTNDGLVRLILISSFKC